MSGVERGTVAVDGVDVRLLASGPAGEREAVVFVHGNPGSADDWAGLLAATAGVVRGVAVDLPDFGETVAPPGFAHDVPAYSRFLASTLAALGVERAHVVLHDFGGPIGLAWAVDNADAVASVTLIDTGVLPGYRWHRLARIWRTPVLGELMQAATTRAGFRWTLRRAEPRGLPLEFVDRMYDHLDRRTSRAILKLYRATGDPSGMSAEVTAALAPRDIPALVIWGEHDAYLPSPYAWRQREAFPSADVHVLPASGHWPFVDAADTVERLLTEFLTARVSAPSAGRTETPSRTETTPRTR